MILRLKMVFWWIMLEIERILGNGRGALELPDSDSGNGSSHKDKRHGNNRNKTNPEEGRKTENPVISNKGNAIIDRLWMEHFALQLYRHGALNESQYRMMMALVDRELAKKYKTGG